MWWTPIAFLFIAVMHLGGCKEKTPARNQIPVLKETLQKLQVAVKDRNRSALDSLLSVTMLEYNQNGDSLIAVAFKREENFRFDHFGDAVFLYTGDNAQVECFVMDSSARRDFPIHLHLVREGKRWLVSHFSFPAKEPSDSTS